MHKCFTVFTYTKTVVSAAPGSVNRESYFGNYAGAFRPGDFVNGVGGSGDGVGGVDRRQDGLHDQPKQGGLSSHWHVVVKDSINCDKADFNKPVLS
jgi:hypothetical protein